MRKIILFHAEYNNYTSACDQTLIKYKTKTNLHIVYYTQTADVPAIFNTEYYTKID